MATSEDKPNEVTEESTSQTSGGGSLAEGDAVASSSGNVPHHSATSETANPVIDDGSLLPSSTLTPDSFVAEGEEQERLSSAVSTDDQQPRGTAIIASLTGGTPSNDSPVSQDTPQSQPETEVKLPVGHTYYFIQMFDADNQVLRTVGSFFSKLDANVKASIRRHLQRPFRQDFLMWKRVDGAAVTTVSPADSFDDVVSPHGACFIVGDKLTKDK